VTASYGGPGCLEAWRETPYYSARERAALEWTEALTLVSESRVSDEVDERVQEQFSEDEMVHLSLAAGPSWYDASQAVPSALRDWSTTERIVSEGPDRSGNLVSSCN
jgi:alkylhydroperoxidase family enzyme